MQIESNQTVVFDGQWPLETVRCLLEQAHRVVLVAHQNADGDAVGSVGGLRWMLSRALGKKVTAILPDGVPDDLVWLPGADCMIGGPSQREACLQAVAEADLIVGLDLNAFSRTGWMSEALIESKASKMLIDHHIEPAQTQFDAIISEPDASSTCELVFWVMRSLYGHKVFDHDSATCLYTGICTDTGTFSFSNHRTSLYLATAELLAYGIEPARINRQIKNVFTVERLRFFGFAMSERLTVFKPQGIGLMVISQADMQRFGVQSAELTGLINEVMRLRDVDCGILVRESEKANEVRLSLRSKEKYDVNLMAAELFDGGGHHRAAGATSHLSLADTVEKVKKHLGL